MNLYSGQALASIEGVATMRKELMIYYLLILDVELSLLQPFANALSIFIENKIFKYIAH